MIVLKLPDLRASFQTFPYGRAVKAFLASIAVLMFLAGSASAAGERKKEIKADRSEPIHITADRLDAYNEQRLVVFSGNAVATQADKVINADSLHLFYRKDSSDPGKAVKGLGNTGDLEKMEARGNVTITQGERIVTGDHAVFYQDEQKIIVTGNAVLTEAKNIIRGERIVVLMNESRGTVESGANKRVTATIYPSEKEKEQEKEKEKQ
jgi:lipopolysaccharide export system protein LptA